MTFEEWWENHLIAREFCGWEKGNAKAAAAAAWRDCGTMSAAMSAAEIATLKAEVKNLKEQVDWQNMPNRNPAARGGYEFYINEEWSCVKTVALGDGTGTIATLMKSRFDPDDDRVRVRLVKDDDALLDDLRKSELLLAESRAEAERLRSSLELVLRDSECLENARHPTSGDFFCKHGRGPCPHEEARKLLGK